MHVDNDKKRKKKQCGNRKVSSWGSILYCLFDEKHLGDCSWEETK